MADNTSIEWTDATWNPVRGCSVVSKGCTNCYAMRLAHRHQRAGGAYQGLTKLTRGGPVWTGEIRLVPELLEQPLKWSRPRRIFVNSMSDLFHEGVPDAYIDQVFAIMESDGARRHTFQVLTKRAARMKDYITQRWGGSPPPGGDARGNIWLGVSAEDQAALDERVPLLIATPAIVRWISAEPLLGPISFEGCWVPFRNPAIHVNWLEMLQWVVVGGESGPGARPMHPAWARSLRDQCGALTVPFFFKQWGAWAPCADPNRFTLKEAVPSRMGTANGPEQDFAWMEHMPKKLAGRALDGFVHDEYPA